MNAMYYTVDVGPGCGRDLLVSTHVSRMRDHIETRKKNYRLIAKLLF